ncbi:MAG TPA: hypothetical protein VK157_14475, partial [Phycisphaerales bacterium]|nr:hypothetical protein [Phycisphaerales bacterium]
NISNTVASIDLRSRVGQSSTVGNGGLTFTNNGDLSIAGLSTTSSAAILVQGQLSQTGRINADTFTLTSYSNGTPTHTLLDTSNTIRELTFEGRNGVGNQISVANLNLADANGIVINLVDTLGRVRFQTAGDVVQGGGTMVRAAGVGYASTNGALTLTSSLNEIADLSATGASVNVFSSTPINVSTVLGQAGIDVTGFARLISSGSISQDSAIDADHLIARTFNSGVVDINLAGANNDVNQLTLETLSTNGATLAANNIRFRDDDGYSVLRLRTAGSGRLGSNGAVNQTNANSGIFVGGSLSLLGTGEWSLTDARNIVPIFAGEGLSINLLNTVDMVIGTGVDGTSGVATDGTNNFLRIVNNGSIAQTDRIQGDQLVLRVVSDGDSFITLDNTNNNFARLTLESRTTGGAAGFSPITYRDADGFSLIRVTTASDAWFHASSAVNQTGANAPIVADRLQLTGSSGSWTLDRSDNSFGLLAAAVNGNVNLTNTRDLVIGSLNGTDGVAVGSGNFFRVVNAGNISQTHAISGDLLVVRTLSDVFTQALVNHPGNNFASVILQSNNRANSGLGAGRLAYRDVDSYSVHGAQTNEQLLLHAEGPVNQLGGTQPIIANGGMRFFGPGGFVFTRTDNRFPMIAGNTGTVFLTTATSLAVGQLGATSGLTTTTNATLTSYGAISQTRPLVVGGTLTATTRASGTGSITLSDLGNRATTANFQVYNGSSTNSAAGNVDWGSSNSYVVGQVRTLGLFTARTNGAATQNGSGIGSASVRVLGTGSFDFSNAANSFTSVAGAAGATNLRTSGALNITQLEGTDGLVSTGNVTLTAGGAITQNRQLRGLSLLATTRNDTGANITLTGPNNFFSGSRTLRTRNANDTSDVAASATYLQ